MKINIKLKSLFCKKINQDNITPVAMIMAAGVFLLTMTAVLVTFSFGINAANNENVNVVIKMDGQIVDTFCGIESKYVTYSSDTGDYSCAGYVKKFYNNLFGVTVYQINTYDGPPLVSMTGHTVNLKKVTSIKPGDIMQNKNRTHVAIVKEVSGSKITLIEQNYKWTSSGTIYARINRTITSSDAYFYRVIIDGKESDINSVIDKDITPPEISNVKISNVTKKGYTVTCNVSDDKGIARVQFPTWTVVNNQDDLKSGWENSSDASGKITGNTVSFRVNIDEHNSEKGRYITHIYAYDTSGNVKGYPINPVYTGYSDIGTMKYMAIKSADGKFINNTGNSGMNVNSKKNSMSSSQIWELIKQSDGTYVIKSEKDGKVMAVNGSVSASGTLVVMENETGALSQKWYVYNNNGSYSFGSACTDCIMTLANGATENTNIKMMTPIYEKLGNSNVFTENQRMIITTLPQRVELSAISSNTTGSVSLKWNKSEYVNGYYLYRYSSATNSYKLIKTIGSADILTYNDTGLMAGTTYKYRIKTYIKLPDRIMMSDYSELKTCTVKINNTSFTGISKTSTAVKLKWTNVSGISGYEIYRSTSKNGKYYLIKTITTSSRKSYSDSGVKNGKDYYYKIRTYRNVYGKKVYGELSAPVHMRK